MNEPKKIILIVDDDQGITRLLKIELEQEDYDISVASDGAEGFEKIKEAKPDAIILDIMMPGMDGYEMLKILKADDETKNIPVVILSVKTHEKDIEKAKKLGAELYITKPFDSIELIKGIRKVSGSE